MGGKKLHIIKKWLLLAYLTDLFVEQNSGVVALGSPCLFPPFPASCPCRFTMILSPPPPLKFCTAGFPRYSFKRYILLMPSSAQVCINHIYTIPFPPLHRFDSRKAFPYAEISSRAPSLCLHYRDFIATTSSSASPLLTPKLRCQLISEALRIMDLPSFYSSTFHGSP